MKRVAAGVVRGKKAGDASLAFRFVLAGLGKRANRSVHRTAFRECELRHPSELQPALEQSFGKWQAWPGECAVAFTREEQRVRLNSPLLGVVQGGSVRYSPNPATRASSRLPYTLKRTTSSSRIVNSCAPRISAGAPLSFPAETRTRTSTR